MCPPPPGFSWAKKPGFNRVKLSFKLYLVSGKHFNDKKDNKKFQIYLLKYKHFFYCVETKLLSVSPNIRDSSAYL